MAVPEPTGGVLYLVGTPIGNLEDLSPRARRVLGAVDLVACEDTRRSGLLLHGLGLRNRLLSFHEHNRLARQPQLLPYRRRRGSGWGAHNPLAPAHRLPQAGKQPHLKPDPGPRRWGLATLRRIHGVLQQAVSLLARATMPPALPPAP